MSDPKRIVKPMTRPPTKKKVNQEYCSWIRTKLCVVADWDSCAGRTESCSIRTQVARVKDRGAGADIGNVVPLCARHHREKRAIGLKPFERKYAVALASLATAYQNLWLWVGVSEATP